ncbi:hypothetical protein D3C72_1807710 [compost metagenome]
MRGTIIGARKKAKMMPRQRERDRASASAAKPPIIVATMAVAKATPNERMVAATQRSEVK